MKDKGFFSSRVTLAMVMVVGIVTLIPGAAAADNPVTVDVEITGTPAFGATVTAAATVTINDGSTLVSVLWSQVKGATAVLSGVTTNTLTATLANRAAYRNYLIHVLSEPPIEESQFPPNVPVPEGEFVGGLQDRFQVVAISPLAEEHAAAIELEFAVTTTSGTYHFEEEILVGMPWAWNGGLRNVPVGLPVMLHGKAQASYDWALTAPSGSSATLVDASSQNPEFTPDMPGTYMVTVTDQAADGATGQAKAATTTLRIAAGLWRGMIAGQDSEGRPTIDTACTGCHAPGTLLDKFTPWKATGHAEIFTNNLDTSTHYGTGCFSCHTVGFNTNAANGGFDDASDYQAFLNGGLLNVPGDNWTTMLATFPAAAKKANIQCENCHGPQESEAHFHGLGQRTTMSSDMCGPCHGEPARHGRFQQWQLSPHANYELAGEEGMSGSCSKCHTGNGFLAWEEAGFGDSNVQVTWTEDEIHPQTCQTCHDPHDIGTTSGNDATNAKVRVSGDTPELAAGFTATDVGRGAICMTCHNSRRGLRNDDNFSLGDAARAPHLGPQADMLMGQNMYFVEVGKRSYHSMIEDACVTCHMESTPPPPDLSYNLGGTNHTFYASEEICSDCHTKINIHSVEDGIKDQLEALKEAIEEALLETMKSMLASGKTIDLDGLGTLTSAGDLTAIEFGESHGRQAVTVTLSDGSHIEHARLSGTKVKSATGASANFYDVADANIAKAAWNLLFVEADGSHGVHNPGFAKAALDVALFAATNADTELGGDAGTGGGPGGGAGAVSCTTPFVYWAEIAAHLGGENSSEWRTDIIARNLASAEAAIRFVLHTDSGNFEATSTIDGGAQAPFEDLVGMLGVSTKGALEICSDKPLLVVGRIFNQAPSGTFGQFLDGHVADLGMNAGEMASLLGLRQATGVFRTNLSVTNGGTTAAEVDVTLYANDGTALTTYSLSVPAGKVVQDLQPFSARAGMPDVGWGFATVAVKSGSNVRTSASVIDSVTGDATTIPAKQ